jgi:flavin reductase (DIM6/NTAB) family NADH-FMN oxidoreductase RutF
MTDASSLAATSIAESFKAVFRQHPSAVALITATTERGPVGLTASSVASVALDPPALSFSVTRATGSAGGILNAPSFVVHLLADSHVEVAEAFAHSGRSRFTPEQGWSRLETGEPYLPDARAALRGRALHIVPVGSSSLVVAEILEVRAGPATPPLLYHDRSYRSLPRADA